MGKHKKRKKYKQHTKKVTYKKQYTRKQYIQKQHIRQKESGRAPLSLIHAFCSAVLCISIALLAVYGISRLRQDIAMQRSREAMSEEIGKAVLESMEKDENGMPLAGEAAVFERITAETGKYLGEKPERPMLHTAGAAEVFQKATAEIALYLEEQQKQQAQMTELAESETALSVEKVAESENVASGEATPEMLPKYASLYEINSDMIGWLRIEDTVIDYPVMQTPENENYYLDYDFYKNENHNGSLILDTDSVAGDGTLAQSYENGSTPSDNLIIHGHTMKSGEMFGGLKRYAEADYGFSHRMIYFDTLYEKREYELIAAFYSQVYNKQDNVFKYYQFFEADTKEAFDDWYNNIKALSLYDTGVTAEYGDEFITLSCCAYHVPDGRFVVVGKRIQ